MGIFLFIFGGPLRTPKTITDVIEEQLFGTTLKEHHSKIVSLNCSSIMSVTVLLEGFCNTSLGK